MEVKDGGIVIIKGDNIENGGFKLEKHFHGGEASEKKKVPLTKESLKEKVDFIRHKLVNGRLWFPVCKYMMLEELVPEGDFKQATEILGGLYPDETFNATDLSRLNVLSFRKPFDQWDEMDSPLKDRTTFYTYKNIGVTLMEV